MLMKNAMTLAGIEPATFRIVAQHTFMGVNKTVISLSFINYCTLGY